jgi:hypothetical protein
MHFYTLVAKRVLRLYLLLVLKNHLHLHLYAKTSEISLFQILKNPNNSELDSNFRFILHAMIIVQLEYVMTLGPGCKKTRAS